MVASECCGSFQFRWAPVYLANWSAQFASGQPSPLFVVQVYREYANQIELEMEMLTVFGVAASKLAAYFVVVIVCNQILHLHPFRTLWAYSLNLCPLW